MEYHQDHAGWERPFSVRTLQEAYYDVISKIDTQDWLEFARRGLKIDDATIDSIRQDEKQWTESRYKMCKAWGKKCGKRANVDRLYNIMNHFLYPDQVPEDNLEERNDASSRISDLNQTANYCSRVGTMHITHPTSDNVKASMLSGYNRYFGKGRVLIVNNNFADSDIFEERNGSQVDVASMGDLWTELGCVVAIEEDRSAEEIIQLLYVIRDCSTEYDFLAVIIMSHGDENDVIYCDDGAKLSTNQITDIFSYKEAPEICEIPKLFFFQCSRGKEIPRNRSLESSINFISSSDHESQNGNIEDQGLHASEYEKQNKPEDTPCQMRGYSQIQEDELDKKTRQEDKVVGQEIPRHLALTMEGPWKNELGRTMLPQYSDMLICYSTAPGCSSFRDPMNGSWYINAIANVFMSYATTEHVLDLMIKVNEALAARSMMSINPLISGACCTPHFECTLRKKLYLTSENKIGL